MIQMSWEMSEDRNTLTVTKNTLEHKLTLRELIEMIEKSGGEFRPSLTDLGKKLG